MRNRFSLTRISTLLGWLILASLLFAGAYIILLPEGDGTAFGSFDGPLYADDLAEVGGFKVSLRSVPEHDVAYGTIVLKNHGARDLEIIQVKPRESTNLSASYFGWRKWHPVSDTGAYVFGVGGLLPPVTPDDPEELQWLAPDNDTKLMWEELYHKPVPPGEEINLVIGVQLQDIEEKGHYDWLEIGYKMDGKRYSTRWNTSVGMCAYGAKEDCNVFE